MADVQPARGVTERAIADDAYGNLLGHYVKVRSTRQILNAGPIHVGLSRFLLGVVPGSARAFLCSPPKVWEYPKQLPKATDPFPPRAQSGAQRLWADECARAFLDVVDRPNQLRITATAVTRYHALVHANVHERVLAVGALGRRVTPLHFAYGVSHYWTEADLLTPRCPTIRHAVMVSLVLALEPTNAAQLIELAALVEMCMPIINRESALRIYNYSATCLARLSPAWLAQAYTLDWAKHGSIERAFRAHQARLLNEAMERDIPLESAAGLHLRRLVGDTLTRLSAETERERDGVEIP